MRSMFKLLHYCKFPSFFVQWSASHVRADTCTNSTATSQRTLILHYKNIGPTWHSFGDNWRFSLAVLNGLVVRRHSQLRFCHRAFPHHIIPLIWTRKASSAPNVFLSVVSILFLQFSVILPLLIQRVKRRPSASFAHVRAWISSLRSNWGQSPVLFSFGSTTVPLTIIPTHKWASHELFTNMLQTISTYTVHPRYLDAISRLLVAARPGQCILHTAYLHASTVTTALYVGRQLCLLCLRVHGFSLIMVHSP